MKKKQNKDFKGSKNSAHNENGGKSDEETSDQLTRRVLWNTYKELEYQRPDHQTEDK